MRTIDHSTRRKSVLNAAINRYIRSAIPVASDDIAEEFDLSPATIRNIFSELDESGLLKHPYTSGGRVPTDKGYRYYVDYLIQQIDLIEDEKQRILKDCKKKMKRFEEAIENSTEVISEFTHYAGIVSLLEYQDKIFYKGISRIIDQPEFKDADKIRLLVKLIEEKKQLLDIINRDFSEKVKVYIGAELGFHEIDGCSLIVASFKIKNHPSGKLAVLGPVRMEYERIIPAMEYISDVLSQVFEEF